MQQPNNQTNERKLSQLMDGEWHELNPSECVAALCEDDALRDKWSRYHMIRDVMKSEPVAADLDLASRISAAIDDEPAYTNITQFNAGQNADQVTASMSDHASQPMQADESAKHEADTNVTSIELGRSPAKKDSLLKTGLTGFAMAASVALVTVVGMNIWQSQSTDQISSVASATPQTIINTNDTFAQKGEGISLPVVEFVSNTGSYWVSPETTERVGDEQRLNMMMSQHFENSPTADREGLLPYSRLVGYDELSAEQ